MRCRKSKTCVRFIHMQRPIRRCIDWKKRAREKLNWRNPTKCKYRSHVRITRIVFLPDATLTLAEKQKVTDFHMEDIVKCCPTFHAVPKGGKQLKVTFELQEALLYISINICTFPIQSGFFAFYRSLLLPMLADDCGLCRRDDYMAMAGVYDRWSIVFSFSP